jgi:light-regulated signal transduction histidine kinase (bacteriophytochrome)
MEHQPATSITLDSTLTERQQQRLTNRLIQQIATLTERNHDIEQFSYAVAHSLRSPLWTIEIASGMLLEDYSAQLDSEGSSELRRIQAAARKMEQLVADLLHFSHLASWELCLEPVDLSELARSIVADLREHEPQHAVKCEITESIIAPGDARLLRLVLENLLGNAWKFTRTQPQPCIAFGSRAAEGRAIYYVRDNGVGFDMAHVNDLFKPFCRLHKASEFPGTGMGLATVQRIVQRHGGHVWANSAPGEGATFYFVL